MCNCKCKSRRRVSYPHQVYRLGQLQAETSILHDILTDMVDSGDEDFGVDIEPMVDSARALLKEIESVLTDIYELSTKLQPVNIEVSDE